MANSSCVYLLDIFFFLLHWQSKQNEDTSATHPILLDELEFEVYSFHFALFAHASSFSVIITYCLILSLSPFSFFACLFIPYLL